MHVNRWKTEKLTKLRGVYFQLEVDGSGGVKVKLSGSFIFSEKCLSKLIISKAEMKVGHIYSIYKNFNKAVFDRVA